MTIRLKTYVSSKAQFSSVHYSQNQAFLMFFIQPNNKSYVSVCVKSTPFLAPVLDRYYEETGSNLSTKPTEKSPFFISYKRDEN